MKKYLAILAVAPLAFSAGAQSPPFYFSTNASGSTAATAYFPAAPALQVRVVGTIATSDKAASVLSFRTGTGAYTIMTNNASGSAVNQFVNTTNGLAANDVVVLQTAAGVMASATVAAVDTNCMILNSGGFGVAVTAGDEVFKMSAASTIKAGATTANYQGQAIYVGNRGRPVRIVLDGTSACSVDLTSAHYE